MVLYNDDGPADKKEEMVGENAPIPEEDAEEFQPADGGASEVAHERLREKLAPESRTTVTTAYDWLIHDMLVHEIGQEIVPHLVGQQGRV